MFYNPIYKNNNKHKPQVEDSVNPEDNPYLDPDLKRILDTTIEGNYYNNEVCFFMDEMAQSLATLTISNIIGEGINVQVKKDLKAQQTLRNFNNHINNRNERIDDWMKDVWIDNLNHTLSLYRVGRVAIGPDDEDVGQLEILRIPPSTIKTVTDPYNGWRKFIQYPNGYIKYSSYKDFLQSELPTQFQPYTIINIPDDPRVVIYVSFFKKAPMNSVNKYIVMKNWIMWFIRKYAEKMWAPLRMAFVGDPKTPQYPTNNEDMEDQLTQTNIILKRLNNFSSASFPGHTRVEVSEPKNSGEIYLKFMADMDNRIAYGLFASMSLRDAPGVYKGAQAADEGLIHFMENIRDTLEGALKRFYIYNLVPHLTEEDIEITWSELRTTSINDIANAFKVGVEGRVFKDANERRKALAAAFPFLNEPLAEAEAKKLDEQLSKIDTPSQAAGTKNATSKPKSSA